MAKSFDWNALYKAAASNTRPYYKKIRNMDRDNFLASIGLERRNVAADVAGAFGFVLLGCAIGVGLGILLAPKPGSEIREDLNRRIKTQADQFAKTTGATSPTYAS
jgi:hypothetical protein